MEAPTIKTPLQGTKKLTTDDSLSLVVEVAAPAADVHYRWAKGDTELPDNDRNTYDKAQLTVEDSGKYTVTAWRGTEADKAEADGGECTVTVTAPNQQTPPAPPPGEWDAGFAKDVLDVAKWAAAAMLVVIVLVALFKGSIAWTVALGLLAIAAVLAAGGIAVTLIDLRGRSRAAAASASRSLEGVGAEALKATAEVLKAWGALGLASAMLALAAIALIAATTLGWRSLPAPSPATDSPSAAASASSAAAPSSSAPSGRPT